MNFKDLKTNYPIYIFDKQNVNIQNAKVINVSLPHLDTHYNNPSDLYIDIVIELDGMNKSFTFKENTETGYTNNLVISTNKDVILKEIEALKAQSEEGLNLVETYKSNIIKCEQLLSDFNPVYKEKQETDKRFNQLEQSICDMKKMLENILKSQN